MKTDLKVGLIARADRSGLAVQTWEFYRNMKPAKTLVINPSWVQSGQRLDASMYPGESVLDSRPYPESAMTPDAAIDAFLDDLDVVFTCETPYNFWLFQRARERGVKTVLQYNYEFLEWLCPSEMPKPDLLAAPSLWNFDKVNIGVNKVFLPVPVNRDALPCRLSTELRHILHTAGTGAHEDRNGTSMMREAMSLLPREVDVHLTIYAQPGKTGELYASQGGSGEKVSVVHLTSDRYFELYENQEDAYFMPRKFGGLCLPLNEASSCGMPVIMTDMSPQNLWVPKEALLEAHHVPSKDFQARASIQVWETTAEIIKDKIVELYYNPELVEELSACSNVYADHISWERMRPVYNKTFEELCNA